MIHPGLEKLIDEIDALRRSRDDAWQIPRPEGELLFHIALASSARVVIEAGTSYGFSGLFWAAAMAQTGGTLHTIDIDPKKVEAARDTFARAGLSRHVVQHAGDIRDVFKSLTGPADIVFLDAGDKSQTLDYFHLAWKLVRPGGSVLTDNATTHRQELASFVEHVRGRPDAHSVEIAVGNGLEWTIKRRTGN